MNLPKVRVFDWRYRRGLPALLFFVPIFVVLLLAHRDAGLGRYVFELRVENRRDVKELTDASEIEDARASLPAPIEETSAECWLELSRGRMGRNLDGKVQLMAPNTDGTAGTISTEPSAAAELAQVVSPYCWRQGSDSRLLAPSRGRILLLKTYRDGARARGFEPFAAMSLLFMMGGVAVALFFRRPVAPEVAAGAALAAAAEVLFLVRSIGWRPQLFNEFLIVRDALGNQNAALVGFAPLIYLASMVVVAAGASGFVVAIIDDVRGQQRCRACLRPHAIEPNGPACGSCGHVSRSSQVNWLVVSAASLLSGLCLIILLRLGSHLGVFEACSWAEPSDSCRKALHSTDGLLDWDAFGRRGLLDGDSGQLVVFRPAVYAATMGFLSLSIPMAVGRFLRSGARTTLAVLPAVWVTSLVVGMCIIGGGIPSVYAVLLRWHLALIVPLSIVGMIAASLGVRFRQANELRLLADLDAEDLAPLKPQTVLGDSLSCSSHERDT